MTIYKQVKNQLKVYLSDKQITKLSKTKKVIEYFGFKFYCPFCLSKLRTMLPLGFKFKVLEEKNVIGGGYRVNAQCPICFCTDRERLVYLYLLNKTKTFTSNLKLLHVAPEKVLSEALKVNKKLNYLSADLDPNIAMIRMDVTDIQYPDESFDLIICNHVLEHIIDDNKAISELYRVLKPQGISLLQVPISLSLKETFEDRSITLPEDREVVFGQSDHVRIYAKDYVKKLEKTGFVVEEFRWWNEGESFSSMSNKYGLLENETVFIAKKYK